MTTGSFIVGGLNTYGTYAAKQWNGGNGRYLPGTVIRDKWNSYTMGDCQAKILGSPVVAGGYCWVQGKTAAGGTVNADATSAYNAWVYSTAYDITSSNQQAIFDANWGNSEEYRLLAKLLTKVKSHQFNAGVAVAEVDKLAKSTIDLVKNMAFGALDLSAGRFLQFTRRFGAAPPTFKQTRKLRLTKDIYGRFLEMQYCWLPTYNDIYEGAKALEEISKGPRKHVFKVSRSKRKNEPDSNVNNKFPPRKWKFFRSYIYEASEELPAYRQMGLGNPLSIVWERIPGSFLLDWVIPIGTWLELIGQVPFLKGRFLRTTGWGFTVDGRPAGTFNPLFVSVKISGPIHCSTFWMSRTTLASLSVPLPSLKVEGAVQGRRVLNAVALGGQLMTRVIDNWANQKSRPRKGWSPNFDGDLVIKKLSKSLLLI